MKKSRRLVLITTGDDDGIGLEVTVKSLLNTNLPSDVRIAIFRRKNSQKKLISLLDTKYHRVPCKGLEGVFPVYEASPSKTIFDIQLKSPPAQWVYDASQACRDKRAHALVTGPLSKTRMSRDGYAAVGHTGILKEVTKTKDLFMCFLGIYFNVCLFTDHIPLSKVSAKLDRHKFKKMISLLEQFKSRHKLTLPLAVLGFNPHAGENGLLGKEETIFLKPLLNSFEKKRLVGPMSPDAAFKKSNWNKFSFFVALYHDQGLIPFKMAHGNAGTHLTLGLPFVRTSVDHGTAFDIFGRNLADYSSMKSALLWALKLTRRN